MWLQHHDTVFEACGKFPETVYAKTAQKHASKETKKSHVGKIWKKSIVNQQNLKVFQVSLNARWNGGYHKTWVRLSVKKCVMIPSIAKHENGLFFGEKKGYCFLEHHWLNESTTATGPKVLQDDFLSNAERLQSVRTVSNVQNIITTSPKSSIPKKRSVWSALSPWSKVAWSLSNTLTYRILRICLEIIP